MGYSPWGRKESTERLHVHFNVIRCHHFHLLPSIFLSIRVFSNDLALLIKHRYFIFTNEFIP